MNDDDYWVDALRNYIHHKSASGRDWAWSANQVRQMDPSLTSQQIYELLSGIEYYNRRDTDMSWNYSYGRSYNDTRGDEVATAVLEAYSQGVSFDALLKKNRTVRAYWSQVQSEKAANERRKLQEQERQRKLAEKRAIEQAKKEEVMQKLSPEELEVFGLIKSKKVTKR